MLCEYQSEGHLAGLLKSKTFSRSEAWLLYLYDFTQKLAFSTSVQFIATNLPNGLLVNTWV